MMSRAVGCSMAGSEVSGLHCLFVFGTTHQRAGAA